MELKELDVVTLEDKKEYVIVDMLKLDGKKYVYISDINDATNYIIGELKDMDITEVEDDDLYDELVIKFVDHLKELED